MSASDELEAYKAKRNELKDLPHFADVGGKLKQELDVLYGRLSAVERAMALEMELKTSMWPSR